MSYKNLIEMRGGRAPKAMMQPELDWVGFEWGRPGDPKENFKGDYGISHIIAKRDHEAKTDDAIKGQNGSDVALRLPIVIDKGIVTQRQECGRKALIEYAGYRVILKLKWDGANKIWMLTGFRTSDKRKTPMSLVKFNSSSKPTHLKTTCTCGDRWERGLKLKIAKTQKIHE